MSLVLGESCDSTKSYYCSALLKLENIKAKYFAEQFLQNKLMLIYGIPAPSKSSRLVINNKTRCEEGWVFTSSPKRATQRNRSIEKYLFQHVLLVRCFCVYFHFNYILLIAFTNLPPF